MNRSTSIAYIDMLMVLFVFFLVCFTIVFAQNKIQEASEGNINYKAEFLITMDWTDGSMNDFDLWVRNPLGEVVYYRNKDVETMTLDRDDQGLHSGNWLGRREIVSIRGNVPGEYVVNVVFWAKRGPSENVKVLVSKLNPYQTIAEESILFQLARQEETIVRFITNESGSVTFKDRTKVSLIEGVVSE